MALFYATCAAGTEALVARFAADSLKHFRLEQRLPGGLIFSAQDRLPSLPYFQNCYVSLARYEGVAGMAQALERVFKDRATLNQAGRAMAAYGFSTFRVMFSEQNALVGVESDKRALLERSIHGASVERARPETEFLILTRSEGFALALLRLTRPDGRQEHLPKGALSPSLAACMVALGRYGRGGVFLDPFAGSGALGKARLDLGGAERVILSDKDPEKVGMMKRRFRGLGSDKLVIRQADALSLGRDWTEGPVQELVCDPPWGHFEPLPMPATAFYSGMLAAFNAIMAQGGRLVVLTADKAAFSQALDESAFEPKERHDILVNGQKAGIFLGVKRESG